MRKDWHMGARAKRRSTCAAAAAIALASAAAHATDPSVWAYGYSAAGQSTCSTFAPTQQIYDAFPYGGTISVSQPQGIACNVGEDLHELKAPLGPVAAGSTMDVSWNPAEPLPNVYLGTSLARADYGVLAAEANASFIGPTSSTTVDGSEAFAVFHEHFTVNAAPGDAGASGTLRTTFTVDGNSTLIGRGYSQLYMDRRSEPGPAYIAYRVQTDSYGSTHVYLNNGYVTMPEQAPGLTIGPTAISGTADVVFETPFTFGTPFAFTTSLFASVIPSSSEGLLGPSGGETDYLSTARLTRIDVLKNGATPVNDFTITSGSGTEYGPHGVPEPEVQLVAEASVAALLVVARSRRPRGR